MAGAPPTSQRSHFDELYGLEVLDMSPEEVRGRVVVGPQHKQPAGIVHGGVYASMAEALASMGTWVGVRDDGNVAMGMANSTTFLRPVNEGEVTAVARPRHRGRTTWVWDVEISDARERLVAVSRMTIAVRPAP